MILTLKTVNQFFCVTLWIIMLHNNTRLGNKMICGSVDVIQTFTDILNFCCDLDFERSNPIFPQDTLAYDTIPPNQVWLQTDQQFKRCSRNSHILIILALAVTLTLKIVNPFFGMTIRPMIIHHHTKCV